MSVIGNIAMVAALVSTSAAFAAPTHLTDSQYIAAARCQGLYSSHALGSTDASDINQLMKSEGAYRLPVVAALADQAMDNAKREARRAGALSRQALVSERDGACQVWAHANAPQNTAAN